MASVSEVQRDGHVALQARDRQRQRDVVVYDAGDDGAVALGLAEEVDRGGQPARPNRWATAIASSRSSPAT